VRLEELGQLKNPMTSSEIEAAKFLLVMHEGGIFIFIGLVLVSQ
jgi:hypothetical protein